MRFGVPDEEELRNGLDVWLRVEVSGWILGFVSKSMERLVWNWVSAGERGTDWSCGIRGLPGGRCCLGRPALVVRWHL